MKRLGYIRVLYDQAVVQSQGPSPLNFSAVLAFHDVMEYFFVLAVAHMGANQSINLRDPFADNAKRLRAPDGGKMSNLDAVHRVGHDRNGFKHNGSVPGLDQIEQARRDATMFLEGNCPRFFAVDFNDISMLHIVPQIAVRDHLQRGRDAAGASDLDTAMSHVTLAFHRLLSDWGQGKHLPGDSFRRSHLDLSVYDSGRRRQALDRVSRPRDQDTRHAFDSLVREVSKAFEETDSMIAALRHALLIQVAGIDAARYARFAMVTPKVSVTYGGDASTYPSTGSSLHTTIANYRFCEEFVVDSALRLAKNDFTLWQPLTYGDLDRAQQAMAANGGQLPDNWQ